MKIVYSEFKKIILITLGSALISFGVTAFILPAQIATGGTPGMAILIHYISNISISIALLMVNIPLILAGIKFITLAFAFRTIYSVFMTSLFVEVYLNLFTFPSIPDMLLSALYGGIFIGAGIGITLKGQASSGGTATIAKIIAHFSTIKPAQTILVLDIIIICAIALIYKDMELALWSLISIYVTTKVVDKILTGSASEKVVQIVSEYSEDIGLQISSELGRQGTILSGHNLILRQPKKVLCVVVGSREIAKLKNIIAQYDKHALVTIMDASEIMGSNLSK